MLVSGNPWGNVTHTEGYRYVRNVKQPVPHLLASFLTLIAAGMGFGARGEIIGLWSRDYSFTNTEIGQISGMGLAGFGVVILIASLVTDFLGYKLMLILALLCHLASGGIMMATSTMFQSQGKDGAYWCLFWGMFIFAVGNGLCEAVINR